MNSEPSPTMNGSRDRDPSGLLQPDRQRAIYRLALESGSVEVADLARRFAVTSETIRRDLSELQGSGVLRRVHGGAVLEESARHEPLLIDRDMQHPVEKLRIAEAAVKFVPEHGSVLIDSGSTLQRLAGVFPSGQSAHVLTNSLPVALTLIERGVDPVTVLGGQVRTNTRAMVDASTVDAVRDLLVDVLFISCDGLSFRRGLTTPYRDEWMVKRAMIESAKRVIALADHSKLGNSQLYPYARFDDIDVLITDDQANPDAVATLRGHVEVHVA